MRFKHFGDYVKSFEDYKHKTAFTIKPFLKTSRISYGELQQKTYQVANYFRAEGLKKGDRVMIVANNCPQWMELFLGCQLVGVILVPVDARNSLETTLKFVAQTEPKLIFRSKTILTKLDKKFKTLALEELDDLIKDYSKKLSQVNLTGQEIAVIVFTSGTTAAPKGVALSQRNILANVEGVEKAIAIDPDWRVLSVLPLSHMYELTGECCMMAYGINIFYLSLVAPLVIARALNDYHITTILAVPQLLILLKDRILQTAAAEGQAKILNMALKIAPWLPFKTRRLLFGQVHKKLGGHLGLVITGGAPIPVEVAVFWEHMGMKAIQGYGLTETSPILTVNRLDNRRLDSQGLVLHNVELRVGDAGEIQAKGPSIFNGYWKNQAQTTQAFTKNGWFKTGDIGQINDGWLQIQGRAKFAIILNSGLNVFPEDIELVAEKYRAIKEICVVGVRTRAGEIVQAVVLSDKKDKVVDKTIKEINSQLEEFQHISSWSRWPESEFPRTLILKVDRKKVQEWANQPKSDFLAPDKKLKNDDPLINILRASLDNPRAIINEKDRLSDIGIDSLRRLAVVSAIEENLGIYIPESKIDQTTTLKGLRKLVDHGNHVEVAIKRPNWQFNKFVRLVGNLLRETVVRGLLRFFVKIHVEGRENIENLESPAIYMFNHVDGFDSPVIYQALPKNIRDRLAVAAADDVLKRHKMLTFIARLSFAGYNLNRTDTILSSLEYTSELIDKGWNIAIAPEGQVSKNGRLQHFKSGTGLLAVETGVLIVPIKTFGLAGTMPLDKKWPQHFSQVTVKIGSPVVFDKSQSYKKATKKLYKIMKKM